MRYMLFLLAFLVGCSDSFADAGSVVADPDSGSIAEGSSESAVTTPDAATDALPQGDAGQPEAAPDAAATEAATDVAPPVDAGPCVPRTCASLGYVCGYIADGCGGIARCHSQFLRGASGNDAECLTNTGRPFAWYCGGNGDPPYDDCYKLPASTSYWCCLEKT